ncbi:response regulator transcription factor [Streptosporangium subroseum]|uniref:response regulator transcription factor n=1 Tax=Streptosporangium subroseum TaxID=106412 RepID=UPI00308567DB|nr:response regulator transcription factor [Streptosporangium subroseum]
MRVVIAEDAALMREGLIALLQRFGHQVVHAAEDADELLRAVSDCHPDVVITDVRMPPRNLDDGLRAALAIRAEHPGIGILVLSQYLGDAYAAKLIAEPANGPRGGVGYLLKDRVGRVTDFMHSLEVIAGGGIVIDPKVIGHLMSSGRPCAIDTLSEREREVLGRMATGESNGHIAAGLHVTEGAVVKHVGNIFAKLGFQAEDGNRRVLAVLTYLQAARPKDP